MQLISFLKKDFVKNVSTLITGSFISQAIFFLILPVLTRLFDKDTFGIFLLFTSSLYILRPLTSLSLELVILIPKRNKDAVNLLFTSIFIGFILNSLLLVVIYFLKDFILSYFNLKTLASSIYLIPLGLFLLNTIEVLNYWNNRKHFFKHIALGNIEKSIVINSFQVYTGLSSFKSIGLIPGYLLGLGAQFVTLLLLSYKSVVKYFKHVNCLRMLYLLKKHKDIPIFNSLLSFSDRLSAELPIILIAIYFGVDEVALYGLAVKFLKTPPGFIGESLSQVFFNKASDTFIKKENLTISIGEYEKDGAMKKQWKTIGEIITMSGDDGQPYQFFKLWGAGGIVEGKVFEQQEQGQGFAPQGQQPAQGGYVQQPQQPQQRAQQPSQGYAQQSGGAPQQRPAQQPVQQPQNQFAQEGDIPF